jgi:hypothetical protein
MQSGCIGWRPVDLFYEYLEMIRLGKEERLYEYGLETVRSGNL